MVNVLFCLILGYNRSFQRYRLCILYGKGPLLKGVRAHNFERASMKAERQVTAKTYGTKEQKVRNISYGRLPKKRFMENSASSQTFPQEQKFEIYRGECFNDGFPRTGQRGNASNGRHPGTIDEEDIIIRNSLWGDCDFGPPIANPVTIRGNGDGRRSGKDFRSDSHSSQKLSLRRDICYDTPTDESRRIGASSLISVAPPLPKIGPKQKSFSEYDLAIADDMNILQHDIPKPDGQLKRYNDGLIRHTKKNNFFRDNKDPPDLALATDVTDNLADDSVPTSMTSGHSAIPRPKKKDSTRKPNFTDNIMLSRDIDQILDEEVGGFGSTEMIAPRNDAGRRRQKAVVKNPTGVQERQVAKDIECIQIKEQFTENTSSGRTSRPQSVNAMRKPENDDDMKAVTCMDTIIEEDLGDFVSNALGRASNLLVLPRKLSRKGVSDKNICSKETVCVVSNKANEYIFITGAPAGPLTRPPTDERDHLDDIMRAKAIEEILEIPVINSTNLPSKQKTKRAFSDNSMHIEKKSKQRVTEARKKDAAVDGSRPTVCKMPEDCTIEELVAEVFPDLLPEVLPSKVTAVSDVNLPDANRGSTCSVTNGDDLRPMAAGPSKVRFGQLNKGNGTCAEKWTTGIFYSDEELRLMGQIERDNSTR